MILALVAAGVIGACVVACADDPDPEVNELTDDFASIAIVSSDPETQIAYELDQQDARLVREGWPELSDEERRIYRARRLAQYEAGTN